MVAITTATSAFPSPATASSRSSPALDAQERTYQAQLADWVTCPSAKTPEGKAKIAHISHKLESIKDQIKKSDTSPNAMESAQRSAQAGADLVRGVQADALRAPVRPGALLDVYI